MLLKYSFEYSCKHQTLDQSGSTSTHLKRVVQHHTGPQRKPAAIDGPHDPVDQVRTVLKHVGPHEVEQVRERVLAAQPSNAQGQVLHDCSCCLPVHQVTVCQRILHEQQSSTTCVTLSRKHETAQHQLGGKLKQHRVHDPSLKTLFQLCSLANRLCDSTATRCCVHCCLILA